MKKTITTVLVFASVIGNISSIDQAGWSYAVTHKIPDFDVLSPKALGVPMVDAAFHPVSRSPQNANKDTMLVLGSHVRCLKELQAMKERLDGTTDLENFRKELLEMSKRLAETNTIVLNLKKELAEISQHSTETSQRLVETNANVLQLKKVLNETTDDLANTKKGVMDMKSAVVELNQNSKKNSNGLRETNAKIDVLKTELKTTYTDLAALKLHSTNAAAVVASVDKNLIAMQNDLNVTKAEVIALKATSSNDKPTSIGKIPASCADLRQLGNVKNGLYNVKSAKKIEIAYCDFTKSSTDASFQNSIGFLDVKSSSAYFYVQLGKDFSEAKSPIPFDKEVLNLGGTYDKTSGKFTAPVTGKYFFSISGVVVFPTSLPDISYFQLTLFKNGDEIGRAFSDEMSEIRKHGTFSLHSVLDLIKGDQIWPVISVIAPKVNLVGYGYTHFSGFLLDEDIVM